LVIPEGGIADFYLNDDEFEAMNKADAEREFGGAGIANFQDVAAKMASYGRYGDDKLVHAETGELIVPKALIEDNPELRDSIFTHLRDMGIEDPERYVVGSDANSINPETGLPEFFLKKIFKKVKKAVKKVVKTVKKVVKKVAPIVLPIVGTAFLGPIYGAALGSGIATLINGGDLGDALKSAVIAGGTGALFSGVSSAVQGNGFMSGVQNAANPANLTEGLKGIGKAFTGDFSGASFGNMKAGPAAEGGTAYVAPDQPAASFSNQLASADGLVMNDASSAADQLGMPSADALQAAEANLGQSEAAQALTGQTQTGVQAYQPRKIGETITDMFTNVGEGDKSFFEAGKELFFPAGPTPEQVQLAKSEAFNKALAQTGNEALALEAAKAVTASSLGPGLISSYLPLAAAGTAAAAAGGFFEAPEQEDLTLISNQGPTAEERLRLNPSEYMVAGLTPQESTTQVEVVSPYTVVPGAGTFPNPFYRPPQYAAEGGEIFPRRTGGIMPDEGIPGQDSVRAMLMPGEFVMTTDAVRGLGNGNLRQGINNMYDMMRGLETRGKAMA